jgi:hypothetical protein
MRVTKQILRTSLAMGFLATAANAAVLVDEQFTDLDRTTQAPPASLQWTYGAHHATASSAFTSLDASTGQLVWDHTSGANNSYSAIWAHFAPGGSPVQLAEGERIRLSFDVAFSGGAFSTSANAFRFQLMNSNNSRVTTDFAGTSETGVASGTTFNAWRGYEALLPVNTTANSGGQFTLRERTGNGPGLNTSSNWTELANASVNEPLFAANTTYPGFLEITNTGSGLSVQGGLGLVTTRLATDGGPTTSFDTVSFFVLDGLTHNVTLDNIRVETSVVPEPGSVVLLLCAVAVLTNRRRR